MNKTAVTATHVSQCRFSFQPREKAAASSPVRGLDRHAAMGNSASVTLLNENSQEMNDADLEKVFRAHDADNSDSIDVAELGAILESLLAIKPSESTLKDLITEVDINNDGVLQLDEFLQLVRTGAHCGDPRRRALTPAALSRRLKTSRARTTSPALRATASRASRLETAPSVRALAPARRVAARAGALRSRRRASLHTLSLAASPRASQGSGCCRRPRASRSPSARAWRRART